MQTPDARLTLIYRLFGWRLGPDYREWVYADITGRRWVLRQARVVVPIVAGLLTVVFVATGSPVGRMAFPTLAILILYVALRNPLMERALRQQGLQLDGEVDPKARWYDDPLARERLNRSGAATVVLLVLGAMVFLGLSDD